MKKKEAQTLGTIIQEYLKALRIDGKMKQVSLINQYESVVGKTVAKATKNLYFKYKTLYIEMSSSIIRHELSMRKEKLISALNEEAGEVLVKNIVFK